MQDFVFGAVITLGAAWLFQFVEPEVPDTENLDYLRGYHNAVQELDE